MPSPVAVPEQPPAGAPLRLVDRRSGPRRSRAGGRGRRRSTAARARARRRAARAPRQERVERLVHEAAAVERRHLVALLGELGDVDPQHVLEEVVERVGRVGLQPGGRHDDVAVGHAAGVEAGEVAVEAGEVAAARARPRCRRRVATRRRRRGARASVDRAAGPGVVEQRAEPVLLLGGRELDAGEPGRERRHRRVPVGMELGEVVGQLAPCSPRRGSRRGSATAPARWCGAGRRGGTGARAPATRSASAASRRRWSSSTRADRSGSAPSVARRSASGSSESSRTRVGNRPSARPHTKTRSRSRPSPSATWPMSSPSPSRPTRPRSASSSSSSVRRNTATPGRGLDRVEPREPGQRGFDLLGRLALDLGPVGPPGLRRQVVAHEPLGPGGELAPARRRGRPRGRRPRVATKSCSVAGRGELGLEVLGVGVALGDRALGRELVLLGAGVALEPLVPLVGAADDLGDAADPLPARCGRGPAVAEHGRRGEQAHDVVALEVAVGEREQAEQPAAEHAVGERADRRAVVGDAGGVELLVHQARRTARARRRARPCARAARPRAPRRSPAARPRAPRRRGRTPTRRGSRAGQRDRRRRAR